MSILSLSEHLQAHSQIGIIDQYVKGSKVLDNVLFYYGYPSGFDGIYNNDLVAAKIIKDYDVWVVGGGYQVVGGADHANTVYIVQKVMAAGVKVFGYTAIGVSSGHTLQTIETSVDQWNAIGVHGHFLDEYGFDFGTDRTYHTAIVNYIRAQSGGKVIFANSWGFHQACTDTLAELPPPANSSTWATDGTGSNYENFKAGYHGLPSPLDNTVDYWLCEDFGCDEISMQGTWNFGYKYAGEITPYKSRIHKMYALSILKESVPGTLDLSIYPDNLNTIDKMAAFLTVAGYVYNMDSVSITGYSINSSSFIPIPKFSLPPSLVGRRRIRGPVFNLATGQQDWNSTTGEASSFFEGDQQLTVTASSPGTGYTWGLSSINLQQAMIPSRSLVVLDRSTAQLAAQGAAAATVTVLKTIVIPANTLMVNDIISSNLLYNLLHGVDTTSVSAVVRLNGNLIINTAVNYTSKTYARDTVFRITSKTNMAGVAQWVYVTYPGTTSPVSNYAIDITKPITIEYSINFPATSPNTIVTLVSALLTVIRK